MVILKYIVAIALLVGWGVGYLCFGIGKEIHLLLGMALMTSSAIIIGKDGALNRSSDCQSTEGKLKVEVHLYSDDEKPMESLSLNKL